MRSAGGETGDELLFLGQHVLLAAVAGQQLLAPDLALALVEVVVAAIGRDGLVRDLDDAVDRAVHEVAVVAGHEQRALVFGREPVLEPDDRLDVQVVGGLVEQQHVGVERQDLSQRDAHLPAAAEGFDRSVVVGNAQAGQHDPGAVFEVVAAAVLELGLSLAVALQQLGHLVVAHGLGHAVFHAADLLAQGRNLDRSAHDLGQRRTAGHIADILAEVADHGLLGLGNLAAVGLFLAHDEPEDAGLAGAVGPDQAAAAGRQNLEARVLEQDLGTVLFGDAIEMDHRKTPCCSAAALARGLNAFKR
ncbi:MAG: hypothetical protein BWY87_01642 [Deltaproteobacteria bacterium ADurb.Bin510]|nr:MAG: hypothetical protein BWY87_01642 [Deltaproteobacteria bacterium ADurb.Bin510]